MLLLWSSLRPKTNWMLKTRYVSVAMAFLFNISSDFADTDSMTNPSDRSQSDAPSA